MKIVPRISMFFLLEEVSVTSQVDDQGRLLPNIPDGPQLDNACRLAREVLDPWREEVGRLKVNSWFRSPEVNKAVGGSGSKPGQKPSAHMDGRAVDIVPLDTDIVLAMQKLYKLDLPWDKIIIELRRVVPWIHVQVARDGQKPSKGVYKSPKAGGYYPIKNVMKFTIEDLEKP